MFLLFLTFNMILFALSSIVFFNSIVSYGNYFFTYSNFFEKIMIIYFSLLMVFIISFKDYSKYEIISENDILNYVELNNINISSIDHKDIYIIKDIIICQNKIAYDNNKISRLKRNDNHLYDWYIRLELLS